MRVTGTILLCCVLLVKGQSDLPKDDTTTTSTAGPTSSDPTTTGSTSTTTKEPTTTLPTTTTEKPAPAPVPTPTPDVPPAYPKNQGHWFVDDCIILKGAIQITVENITEPFNVPPAALANGSCSGAAQTLILTWNSTISDKINTLILSFEENSTKENSGGSGITAGKYALQDVKVAVFSGNTTEAVEASLSSIAAFQTPLNHSFSCLAEETLKSPNASVSLKIRQVQLEAFRRSPAGHREFSTAVQCPADDATDVVPIAVGAALAGLVVIVLIAYLIGRKRSRARGYQSV